MALPTRPRIIAYVSNENCKTLTAYLPGTEVNGQAISKHGDFHAWAYNKTETLAGASRNDRGNTGLLVRLRKEAQIVCHLKNWEYQKEAA